MDIEARVIQVIETKSKRGIGSDSDPGRYVKEYWEFDGNKLAEYDPVWEAKKHD